MGILIACLTTGKGTWKEVSNIINAENWKKIYLITNEFGKEKFTHEKELNYALINLNDTTNIMRDKIIAELKDLKEEVGFNDVALNFSSGSGKEHMALLSAIMKLGTGIRIVDQKNKEIINL